MVPRRPDWQEECRDDAQLSARLSAAYLFDHVGTAKTANLSLVVMIVQNELEHGVWFGCPFKTTVYFNNILGHIRSHKSCQDFFGLFTSVFTTISAERHETQRMPRPNY